MNRTKEDEKKMKTTEYGDDKKNQQHLSVSKKLVLQSSFTPTF